MTRTSTRSLSALLGLALAFTSTAPITAQATQPPASSAPQSAALPIEDKKDQQETKDAPSMPPPQSAAAPVAKDKKGKQEYTGPNTVVELPPTPMLDEEGKQRQDPMAS